MRSMLPRPKLARLAVATTLALLLACGGPQAPSVAVLGPAVDRDGDGVADTLDACAELAEDVDGVDDGDGCPDLDDDHDGIADVADLCPCAPEDGDGWQDEDGCPDLDDDEDRIPDACDRCPREPETYNGTCDEDGCPDSGPVLAMGTRIVILDRVYFGRGSAAVAAERVPVLDAVAAALAGNPQITRVRLLGSTARGERARGGRSADLALARAEAIVDALVARGIDRARLVAEAAPPEDPHDAEASRAVRFVIHCDGGDDEASCDAPDTRVPYRACEPMPACTPAEVVLACDPASRSR